VYICRQLIPTTAFLVVSDARTMLKADIAVMKNFHVLCLPNKNMFLVHGQVAIIFVVSVGLSVCLFVQSFSQPSLIRFRSNLDICYVSGSSCVP